MIRAGPPKTRGVGVVARAKVIRCCLGQGGSLDPVGGGGTDLPPDPFPPLHSLLTTRPVRYGHGRAGLQGFETTPPPLLARVQGARGGAGGRGWFKDATLVVYLVPPGTSGALGRTAKSGTSRR
eukprot:488125-Hanusia_phi.AAC.1